MAGRGKLMAYAGLGLVALYLIACGAAFFMQGRMVFPAWAVPPHGPLRPGSERLTLDLPNGDRLQGVYIPPRGPAPSDTLILVFPGNATNAQVLAEFVADLLPDHPVAAFYYRGYAPSTGTSAAEHLRDDASEVYDLVRDRYQPARIVAYGQSLGSGVAASLAPRRPLAGLVLVTPFDSLQAVARQSQPLLPVSLLFRHEMDSVAALAEQPVPVAIIAAAKDVVIRPARTDRLRQAVSNLAYDLTIPETGHADVHLHAAFAPALREAVAEIEAASAPAVRS